MHTTFRPENLKANGNLEEAGRKERGWDEDVDVE
jgi:hypothetical protein